VQNYPIDSNGKLLEIFDNYSVQDIVDVYMYNKIGEDNFVSDNSGFMQKRLDVRLKEAKAYFDQLREQTSGTETTVQTEDGTTTTTTTELTFWDKVSNFFVSIWNWVRSLFGLKPLKLKEPATVTTTTPSTTKTTTTEKEDAIPNSVYTYQENGAKVEVKLKDTFDINGEQAEVYVKVFYDKDGNYLGVEEFVSYKDEFYTKTATQGEDSVDTVADVTVDGILSVDSDGNSQALTDSLCSELAEKSLRENDFEASGRILHAGTNGKDADMIFITNIKFNGIDTKAYMNNVSMNSDGTYSGDIITNEGEKIGEMKSIRISNVYGTISTTDYESIFSNAETKSDNEYYKSFEIKYDEAIEKDAKFEMHIASDGSVYYTYDGKKTEIIYGDYYNMKDAEAEAFSLDKGGIIAPSRLFIPKNTVCHIIRNGQEIEVRIATEDLYAYSKGQKTALNGVIYTYDADGKIISQTSTSLTSEESDSVVSTFKDTEIIKEGNKWYSRNVRITSEVNNEGMITATYSYKNKDNGITYTNGSVFTGKAVYNKATDSFYYETSSEVIKTFDGMSYAQAVQDTDLQSSVLTELVKKAISEYSFASNFAGQVVDENGESILDADGKIRTDKIQTLLENLTYAKEQTVDENGNVILTGWSIYYKGIEQPVIKITPDGFVDFSLETDGIKTGIRYTMSDINEDPVSLVAISDNKTLVVDYYERSAFIEERDPNDENALLKRYYLSPNGTEVFSQEALLKVIKEQKPTTVEELLNLKVNGSSLYRLTRTEEFTYTDTLHKFLEIPSYTLTTAYSVDGTSKVVSESKLDSLSLEKQIVEYTVKVYDKDINFEKNVKIYRNLQGQTMASYELDKDGKPITADFYFDYNEFGIAKRSISLVKDGDSWVVLRESDYIDRAVVPTYNDKNITESAVFRFKTIELADTVKIDLNTTNLSENISSIEKLDLTGRNIKQVSVTATDGYGRRVLSFDGYSLDQKGNLSGEPRYVTFSFYNSDTSVSFLNVSELLGYATNTVTCVYNEKFGYDVTKYLGLNSDGSITVKSGVSKLEESVMSSNFTSTSNGKNILVYNVNSEKWNTRSVAESGYNYNGTYNYQIFKGLPFKGKILKGQLWENATKLYYDSKGFPSETYLIKDDGTEVLYQKHYTVLINDHPGCYFIYSVDQDNTVTEAVDNMIYGKQIDASLDEDGDGIIVVDTMDEAAGLAERSGMYFENGVHKYNVESKFAPIVYVDYNFSSFSTSVVEYVKVLLKYHSGNTLLANIFDTQKRQNLVPFLGTVSGFLLVFTVVLPIALYLTAKGLASTVFKPRKFRKQAKVKIAEKEGVPPQEPIVQEEKTEEVTKEESLINSKKDNINLRISRINKHMRLLGDYNDYLTSLFYEDPTVLADRYLKDVDNYKEIREKALQASASNNLDVKFDFIENYILKNIVYLIHLCITDQQTKWDKDMKGEGILRDIKDKADYTMSDIDLKTVFKYYLEGVAKKKEELNKNTSLTQEERAQEMLAYKNAHDPMVENNLTKYFNEVSKIISENNADEKLKKSQAIMKKAEEILTPMRKWLAEEYERRGIEQPRYPVVTPVLDKVIRGVWVISGAFIFAGILAVSLPALPFLASFGIGALLSSLFVFNHWISAQAKIAQKETSKKKDDAQIKKDENTKRLADIVNKITMVVTFVAAVAFGALGVITASGTLTVGVILSSFFAPVVLASGWYMIGHWLLRLAPFLKFRFIEIPKMFADIIKSAKEYKGDIKDPILKENISMYKKFFAVYGTLSVLIVVPTLFFAIPVLPAIAWLVAGPILFLTVLMLWNTVWNFMMAAKGTAYHQEGKVSTITSMKQIDAKKLNVVRNNGYLLAGFKDALVKNTLLDFDLITDEQAKELNKLIDDKTINKMPEGLNSQAQEEIIRFFNLIESLLQQYGGEKGFQYKVDSLMVDQLLPVIVKGTGKKRIIPDVAFLDGEATAKEETVKAIIKSGFRTMKETYPDSWSIFMHKLLKEYNVVDVDSFIKENNLNELDTTLKNTINTIAEKTGRDVKSVEHDVLYNWVIYRSDGYLKTLLYAEKSAEVALRSFLKYKLSSKYSGEELDKKVAEELKSLLMFVHVHEDIDPDKASSNYGSGEAQTIVEELGKRGYLLNKYGAGADDGVIRILMSTKGNKNDEYAKDAASKWTVKTDKWSITYENMSKFLSENGKDDAMIVNLDRDHFFFPSHFFFLPILSSQFADDPNMGWALAQLDMKTAGVSPVAASHAAAEDVWNNLTLSAQQESATNILIRNLKAELAKKGVKKLDDINYMALIFPKFVDSNGNIRLANRLDWPASELAARYVNETSETVSKLETLRSELAAKLSKQGIDISKIDIESIIFNMQKTSDGNYSLSDRSKWTAEELAAEYLKNAEAYKAKPMYEQVGSFAFYGPGFMRYSVLGRWGYYMSNIEDTGAAGEALKDGYHGGYAPYIVNGRPREMLMDSITAFQTRFGGLVVDYARSVPFQQLLKSDKVHWTQKLTLFNNFNFYFNKPIAIFFNALMFVGSLLLSFSPFAPLAFGVMFMATGFLLSQAISSGTVALYVERFGKVKGIKEYMGIMWALVSTFVSLLPLHVEKVLGSFEGKAGVFTSGIKDIVYPQMKFKELYSSYSASIKFGIGLLVIALLSPVSPFGFIGQFFVYMMAFVFIFGPFTFNADHTKAEKNVLKIALGSLAAEAVVLLALPVVAPIIQILGYSTIAVAAIALGIIHKKSPRGSSYVRAFQDGVKAIFWSVINPRISSILDGGLKWLCERNSDMKKVENADAILLLGTKYPKVAIGAYNLLYSATNEELEAKGIDPKDEEAVKAYKKSKKELNAKKPIFILAGVGRETGTLADMKAGKNTRIDKKKEKADMTAYTKALAKIDEIFDTLASKSQSDLWKELQNKFGIVKGRKQAKDQYVASRILELQNEGKSVDEIFKTIEEETVKNGDEEKTWTQFYFKNGALTSEDLQAIADGRITIEEIAVSKLLDKSTRDKVLMPEAFLYYAILVVMGVDEANIKIDAQSTTTVENMLLGTELMKQYLKDNKDASLNKLLVMQEPYLQKRAKATVQKQLPKAWNEWKGQIISYAPYLYGNAESFNIPTTNEMRKNFVSEVDKMMARSFDGNLVGEKISFGIMYSSEKMRFMNKFKIDEESGILKLTFFLFSKIWIAADARIKSLIFNAKLKKYNEKYNAQISKTPTTEETPADVSSDEDTFSKETAAPQASQAVNTDEQKAAAANAKFNEIRNSIKAIEKLLNDGMNERALNAFNDWKKAGEYEKLQQNIGLALDNADYSFSDSQKKKLDLYKKYEQVILDSIKFQKHNISVIESPAFIADILQWINTFDILKEMLAAKPSLASEMGLKINKKGDITGFTDSKYEAISRSMAKEVNRRLASRDGYLQFSTDPADAKGYERYNRVKEGVVQVITRAIYDKVVVNEWVYEGDFEKELNITAYEIAYDYFAGIIRQVKTTEKLDLSGLSESEKTAVEKVVKEIKSYEEKNVTRNNVINEAEETGYLVSSLINASGKGLEVLGKFDKKALIYSAAPGTGKDELAGRILGKGIVGRLVDPAAKMKILHTRDLRPGEVQGEKYVFYKPEQLSDLSKADSNVITVLVNGQLQGAVLGEKAEVPVFETNDKGKVGNAQIKKQEVKGIGALYGTNKLSTLEGGFGWALVAKKAHPQGSFIFISPFTDEEIFVRGKNNQFISETFQGEQELRLANECLQEMITENKGEVDLAKDGNLSKLISKVEDLLGKRLAKVTVETERKFDELRSVIKQTEKLLNDGMNERALNSFNALKESGQYKTLKKNIENALKSNKYAFDKKQKSKLELYLQYEKEIQNSIKAQNANIAKIESQAFIQDMIEWINTFSVLTKMFSVDPDKARRMGLIADKNGKVTGFINAQTEFLARAMAKEVNRRLASRDGYLQFNEGDKGIERYNRVKEGVVQVLTRSLYNKVIVNEWVYQGDFEKELNITAYDMAYQYFIGMAQEMTKATVDTKGLTAKEIKDINEAVNKIKQYLGANKTVTRENVVSETDTIGNLAD
jgi:hypothetical protein